MRATRLVPALLASAALALPADRAKADIIDFVAGAVATQAYNHFVRNRAARQPVMRSTESSKSPEISAAPQAAPASRAAPARDAIPASDEGRALQEALNFFGFEAGSVDGRIGPQSREAISAYQEFMDYPVDGELDRSERTQLMETYDRARTGDFASEQVALGGDAARDLLRASGGSRLAEAPAAAPDIQRVAFRTMPTNAEIIARAGREAPAPQLVNLFAPPPAATASLASQCADTSLVTGTNGFMTGLGGNGAAAALSEQLCVARAYAIRDGEDLASGLTIPPRTIAESCGAYGEEMRPHIAALATSDRDGVLDQVGAVVQRTGIASEDLAATATVCLSEGYRTDDMDVALGSALILTSLGQEAYAELPGHHLALGFGTGRAPERAGAWYSMGLAAADRGAAVFAPGQPERIALIRDAADALAGGDAAAFATPRPVSFPILVGGQ